MMELRTETLIHASPERVWAELMDFAAYPAWNPFIRALSGDVRVGGRLTVHLQPEGGRPMTFRPVVRTLTPGRELVWRGRVGLPGVFDGEHRFALVPLPEGGVRFEHTERFSGLLVPFLHHWLEEGTRRGFEAMNRALKARAEALT